MEKTKMTDTLWEVRKFLVSPEGYQKIYDEIGLYHTDEPNCDGKTWYTAPLSGGCGKTWLTFDEASIFIANSVIDEIIAEENNIK
jgi:hypothetical protein